MFTNDLSSRQRNLSGDTIPDVLKNARQFHLDNPIALQKEYLKANDGPGRADLREAVKASEQSTLGMLVDLFDWLDGFGPQAKEIVSLHERSQVIKTKVSDVDPVPPGPKEAEIRLDSRIPPNPPSNTATRTTDLDEAKESRHAPSGSNTDTPGAQAPNNVSAISITRCDLGGSRGRSSQVSPGSEEAGIRVNSRIHPTPPPNTASGGVGQTIRQATTEFRGVTPHSRGSDGENQSNTSTIE